MTPRPTPLDVDPALRAVFGSLLAYMGNTYPSGNCYANYDSQGTNVGASFTAQDGSRWSYTEFIAGVRVAIEPAGIALGAGGTQQFTATATNPDGTPVAGAAFTWSVQAGSLGTIDAAGLYTAPAGISVNAADTIKCQLTDGNSWATVTVSLTAG